MSDFSSCPVTSALAPDTTSAGNKPGGGWGWGSNGWVYFGPSLLPFLQCHWALSLAGRASSRVWGRHKRLFNTSSLFPPRYGASLSLESLEQIPRADLSEGSRECYSISSCFFSRVLSFSRFKPKSKWKPWKQGARAGWGKKYFTPSACRKEPSPLCKLSWTWSKKDMKSLTTLASHSSCLGISAVHCFKASRWAGGKSTAYCGETDNYLLPYQKSTL